MGRRYRRGSSRLPRKIGEQLAAGFAMGIWVLGVSIRDAIASIDIHSVWAWAFGLETALLVLAYLFERRMARKVLAEQELMDQLQSAEFLKMTSRQFEEFVAQVLSGLGYIDVELTPATADGGFDVGAQSQLGERIIVECKRYAPGNPVGVKAIREFDAVVRREKANVGFFITTSKFTISAVEWAQKSCGKIELIDRHQLTSLSRTLYAKGVDELQVQALSCELNKYRMVLGGMIVALLVTVMLFIW